MVQVNRRQALALGRRRFYLANSLFGGAASAQASDKLTIAFNVNLPAFDPHRRRGPRSIRAFRRSTARFSTNISSRTPILSFAPGLLTKWGWNDDKTKVWMDVREGVVWHDGTPMTPDDIVWSIQNARAIRRMAARCRSGLGLDRQLYHRRPAHQRRCENLRSHDLRCGWGSSPASSCPRPITPRSARMASRRSRSAQGHIWSTNIKAMRSCA